MKASSPRRLAVILVVLFLLGGALLVIMSSAGRASADSSTHASKNPAWAVGQSEEPSRAREAQPPVELNYGAVLLQMIVAVIMVCLLAWAILRWGLGRLANSQNQNERMRILGRLALSPNRAVVLVQVGEKCLVLGSSEAGLALLYELPTKTFSDFMDVDEHNESRQEPELVEDFDENSTKTTRLRA